MLDSIKRFGFRKSVSTILKVSLVLILFSVPALAGKRPGFTQPDLPVTSNLADYYGDGMAYFLQSDGLGPYVHNATSGPFSALLAGGYNNASHGDWVLDMNFSTTRTAVITFSEQNLVQPGDPGYRVAPVPPFLGTRNNTMRIMLKCTFVGINLIQMRAGQKQTCPGLFRMAPTDGTTSYYVLSMWGLPEVEDLQVSCNSEDTGGCNDWYVTPIPVVNSDGSTSAGKTRARMEYHYNGKGKGSVTERGAVYMTYHFHITRP